jgi:hypothetical protein
MEMHGAIAYAQAVVDEPFITHRNPELCAKAFKLLLAKLDWYERREPYVRALAGACEDGYANHENGEPGEAWRALVDFELNEKSEP